MRFKLAPFIFVASCLPTMALAALPAQGNITVVSGRAHVVRNTAGTYIHIERSGSGPSVTGLIPYGNQRAYPGLADLEGRRVAISGVLYWNGRPMITMTDPDQLDIGAKDIRSSASQ